MKTSVIALLVFLVLAGSEFCAEPERISVRDLLDLMRAHPEQDFSKYVGGQVEVEGFVTARHHDQPVMQLQIFTRLLNTKAKEYGKYQCAVILHDSEIEKVANYPAGGLEVKVTGILQGVDAKGKMITVKSQDTIVTGAD